MDHDRDGVHERRLFRTCDGALSYEADSLSLWQHIVNMRELIEVGDDRPTLHKEVSDSGTVWYVEERDVVSGTVLCRSTLIDGYVRTDCKHKLIGTPCFFDYGMELPAASEMKEGTQEEKTGEEAKTEIEQVGIPKLEE